MQERVLLEYCSIKREVEPYDMSIVEWASKRDVRRRQYKQLLALHSQASSIHYYWGQLHDRVYSAQSSG